MRDKSYARSPVGRDVLRYINALRWADYPETTRDSYETTLARLATEHDDYPNGLTDFCTPVGTEYLRDFLERNWGDSAAATKRNRTSAVRSCFQWAHDEGLIEWNPAAQIKVPRKRGRNERVSYPQEIVTRLVAAQDSLRDQCCVQLLGLMGLRKNELRVLKVGEIDLIRDLITLHRKGGKIEVQPLVIPALRKDLYLHIQGEGRAPDEYLLYPRNHRSRPMNQASVHRWFKRCLENAGLPASMMIHEMRHTAADHLWRQTGNIVMAQTLLGHENASTTQAYLHPTRADLASSLASVYADWTKGN